MNGTSLVFAVCLLICGLTCSSSANPKPVKVTVDPRIELLSAVRLLSGDQDTLDSMTRFDFPYKQKMAEFFGKYKDHRAVRLLNEMSKEGFNACAQHELLMCASDPPGLSLGDLRKCLPPGRADVLAELAGGEKQLTGFVDALREFARDTDFQRFFEANADTYEAIIDAADSKVRNLDVVGSLEEYVGSSRPLLVTMVLAPLVLDGGFGPTVEHSDGVQELFDICGPSDVKDGLPSWGAPEDIRNIAWHEFGHSFVNPLVYKHEHSLAKYSSLHNPIASQMRSNGYGDNWQTCVCEHIVRAVTARLVYRAQGSKAADDFIEQDSGRAGFAYTRPLCKRLEDYEKHRDKYPTLESFFPELVGVFRDLYEARRAGHLGPDFYGVKIESGGPGISPDGARIAYTLFALDKNGDWVAQVWVSDLAGSSRKKIAQIPYPESHNPPSVAWRENSRVIISAEDANVSQVSLDGKWHVLSSMDKYNCAHPAHPCVSPDGKWAAFNAFEDDARHWGIFLLNMESGAVKRLSSDECQSYVSWSPDSKKLAYGESRPMNRPKLKVCDIETGKVTDTGREGIGADWSPDGLWLAYTGNIVKCNWWTYSLPADGSIVKMNLETKETQTLTEPGTRESDGASGSVMPVWSPDGRWIAYRHRAYRRETTEHDEIWAVSADGTGRKKLRDEWSRFVWAPDGKAIFVNTQTGIERVAVDKD